MRPLVNCRSFSVVSYASLRDLLHFPNCETGCVISGYSSKFFCIVRKQTAQYPMLFRFTIKMTAPSDLTMLNVALHRGLSTGLARVCTLTMLHLLRKCGRSLHHLPKLRHRCKIAPPAAIFLWIVFIIRTPMFCTQNMESATYGHKKYEH